MIGRLANHSEYSGELEDYFFNCVPKKIWEEINFKNENAYLAMHIERLAGRPLSLNDTHWYVKDPYNTLPIRVLHECERSTFYEVKVRVKKRTTDIIGIIKPSRYDQPLISYVDVMEKHFYKKIASGMFTFCDSGFIMPIHKDVVVETTPANDNVHRIHHVLKNGGISSLVTYDDDKVVTDRFDGQRGDIFHFDASKYFHDFGRPLEGRLHFIVSHL